MANAKVNFDNIVQRTSELESVMRMDSNCRLRYRTYAIPIAILEKLEQYIQNLDEDDLDFDYDGVVTRLSDDDAINELLLTMFRVEVDEKRFTVNVSFLVDAHTKERAREIVENAIEFGNYDIDDIEEE